MSSFSRWENKLSLPQTLALVSCVTLSKSQSQSGLHLESSREEMCVTSYSYYRPLYCSSPCELERSLCGVFILSRPVHSFPTQA